MDAIKKGDVVRFHGTALEIPHDVELPDGAGPKHSVTLRARHRGDESGQTFVYAYPRYVHVPLVCRPAPAL